MLAQKIEEALEEINEGRRVDGDVLKILEKICYSFSIRYFSLAIFYGEKSISESFFMHSTYAEKWQDHYIKNKYYLCDPAFTSLQKIAIPFEWEIKKFKDLTPQQSNFAKEAYNFGIRSGLTIPLFPQSNFHGFFTIFNQAPLHPDILYTFSLIANFCTSRIMEEKAGEFLSCLTKREREVLFEKAQALSVKDVSIKLKISHSTAAFHLTNIRKKLGVHSSERAVSKFLTHTNQSIKLQGKSPQDL